MQRPAPLLRLCVSVACAAGLQFACLSFEEEPGDVWVAEAGELLEAGRCEEAILRIESVPDSGRDSSWYEFYASANLACSEPHGGRARVEIALAELSAGETRFPDSAAIRMWKGVVLERAGREQEARDSFETARALAERSVALGGDLANEGRRVLRQLESNGKKDPAGGR